MQCLPMLSFLPPNVIQNIFSGNITNLFSVFCLSIVSNIYYFISIIL